MVVTYKMSYSNNHDSDDFSWTWNGPASVNKYFHFALKFITVQKPSGVFDAPYISDYDTHFWVHYGPHFKLNGKAVVSFAGTKYVTVSRFCVARCLAWQRSCHKARYANEKQTGYFKASDSQTALYACLLYGSARLLHRERADLKTVRDRTKSSELHGLCLFLDRYEMLRVSGSLKNSSFPYEN